MSIASDIQKLAPGRLVELFELDATAIGGTVFRFHAGTNELQSSVVWQGNVYTPYPVDATGFEWSGRGTLPRPKVRVANIFGLISALCMQHDDMVGAKLTRKRTFVKYLDVENFSTKNLLRYTQLFNTWWYDYGTSFPGPAVLAPDGTMTAYKMVESANTVGHNITSQNVSVTPGLPYTASVYVKPDENRWAFLWIDNGSGSGHTVELDCSSGATRFTRTDNVNYSNTSCTAVAAANGYYRVSLTTTPISFTSLQVRLYMAHTKYTSGSYGTPGGYMGDGTSGLIPWGFQFEQSSSATSYSCVTSSYNPSADPTAKFPDEVWFIERKAGENKIFAEFELSTSFDVQGIKIPRRQTIQNVCPWKYKSAECSYVPGAMFTDADVATSNPALDKCGKRLTSCKLRFGTYAQLPYGGFPGVGLVR